MTFGEHLEELRVVLFKALIGLVIGCAIGLYFGDLMVKAILYPLEDSLEIYYSGGAIDKFKEWKTAREEQNLPVPYTTEQIEHVVNKDRMLFEIVYLDPRQARDEVFRTHPEWARAAEVVEAAPTAESNIAGGLAPMFLFHPAKDDDRIHAKSFSMPEMFGIWMKASFVLGAIISSPWVFYQIWSFVAAGLYPHEKRYVHVFLPVSLGLFLLGAAMAYLTVFRPVLGFLLNFNHTLGVDPDPRISEWLGFVLMLPLGFGVSFQLPLVMLFLDRINIFSVRAYIEKWRIAVLVIFILSAVLTPADPYSILIMAVPLTFLYFAGVALCHFLPKDRPAETA